MAIVERQHQRFPASLPGALMASDGPHIIRSVDISRNGCRIQNTVELVPGTSAALLLFPPEEVTPLVIPQAMVRWSGVEGVGIEFQAVEFRSLQRLDLLINRLKETHSQPSDGR